MAFACLATAAMSLLAVGLFVLGWRDRLAGGAIYLLLLPLVNISVTLSGIGKTVSYDKLALLALSMLALLRTYPPAGILSACRQSWTFRIWTAYLAVTLAAALAGPAPWKGQVWPVTEIALFFLVFLFFFNVGQAPEERRLTVWRSAILGCGVLFILLIGQNVLFQMTGGWKHTGQSIRLPLYLTDHPALTDLIYDFLPGPIGHPNYLAAYFLLLLPIYALLFRPPGRLRTLAVVLSVLHLLGVFAVPSRSSGGILGFICGVLAMGMLWSAHAWKKNEDLAWLKRPGSLLLSAIFCVVLFLVLSPFSLETSRSVEVRGYLYRSAAAMVRDRPLFGYGLDSFPETFTRLEQMRVSEAPAWRRLGTPISAHSSFLKAFFEQGIPGGLLFLGLIAGSLTEAARRLWRSDSLHAGNFGFWAWGGCLGFAVQAATEELFSFTKTASLYWAMTALCLTAGSWKKEARI